MPRPRYPSEVFGYPLFNVSAQAKEIRAKHWCPFVDKVCYKQSRLINYPFGVCTAHVNDDEVALCPRRFLDGHTVFTDIAQHHFNTTSDILVFSEIRLKDIGSFDFVMVKHKPMSAEIEDFVVIEFQTGQTTGTGQLVQGLKDFVAGESTVYKSYGFGLNLYDIWKRTFTQILTKGVIMETWKKKIYWVVQELVYKNFEARYRFQRLSYKPQHSTVFALYDLKSGKDRFEMVASRKISATMDQLFDAFRNNPNIPSVDAFLAGLKQKIETEAQISLQLGRPSRTGAVDVKPPTASGKIRESSSGEKDAELFDDQSEER
ncbi:MAG: NotI family restriction endonuclease [Verrucomicrobiia bacterium]